MRRHATLLFAALSMVAPSVLQAAFPELAARAVFDMAGTYDYFVGAAQAPAGIYLLGSQTLTLVSGGKSAWTAQLSGSWGYATALAVDGSGNAYVSFSDLGAKTAQLMKYDAGGNLSGSVSLPYSGPGYWPDGYGVAVDAGNIYAAESVYDQSAGRYKTVTFRYSPELELAGEQEYFPVDQQTCSGAAIPSGGVHISASGEVLVGGYSCKDDYTYRYFMLKYTPGLGQLEGEYLKDAAFDESPQLKAGGDPTGGMVFIGNEIVGDGAAGFSIRRVNGSGVWSEPVFITAFDNWSWPKAVAVDKAGAAYIAGNMKDTWAPAVTKLNADGSSAWNPLILQKPDEGSLETVYVDDDLNMRIAGYHTWNTDSGFDEFYLESWSQGGEEDAAPPAAVTSLSVTAVSRDTITLAWTAPGDDGNTGTAASYDLGYSAAGQITTDAEFAAAVRAQDVSVPQAAGSAETFIVKGLSPATTYFFALKTADEAGNISGLSNCVSAETCVEVAGVPNWKQYDDGMNTWWDDDYDHTTQKIGALGCLLTAAAQVVKKQGYNTDPGELNKTLKNTPGGFDGKSVYLPAMVDAITASGVAVQYKKTTGTAAQLNSLLDAGLKNDNPVVLELYSTSRVGRTHFVVVTKKCGDAIYINDPGNNNTRVATLKDYFNLIANGNPKEIVSIRMIAKGTI
ncbi:MAG: fibronectin type III domain-containing protein [Elusimicrobia bacterium]|nr:fibronectin type III domain-containing protein [Elusimicrobiota bacterium]